MHFVCGNVKVKATFLISNAFYRLDVMVTK